MFDWGDEGGFFEQEDEIEDNNAEGHTFMQPGRDALIFLIDASQPMFTKQEDGVIPFQLCLQCIRSVFLSKVISNTRDLIGVIFYGTEKNRDNTFDHLSTFLELDSPGANQILTVEEMEKKFKDNFELGHSNDYTISDALWACSNMFASSSRKLAAKRILLFTNQHDPHADQLHLKRQALKKGTDLRDLGIDLQLLHMKPASGSFDATLFYRDLLNTDECLADPSEHFDELLTRVRTKEAIKRAITRLPFHMADGLKFGVSIYSLNRQCSKPPYVKIDSRTNEEIRCVTKHLCQDTGEELLPTDMKCYQDFGGAKVIFEKEEVDKMKAMVEPGFHLLGFKPASLLKVYYHVKPSSFIYADESKISGSTNIFALLLKRCVAKEVTPICVMVSRASTPPRFVCLLPQRECLDEHGTQTAPSGFHVVYLPYSDDIRKLNFPPTVERANDQQVDEAKRIVDRLKFNYTVDAFENPSLQKFYRYLEALALDRENVEEFTDLTLPNVERINKKAEEEIAEFKKSVFPEDYDSSKRKASSDVSSAVKKAKVEPIDIKEAATRGNLVKVTVPLLKTFCQENRLKPKSQRKADLISAINTFFKI